MVKAAFRMVRTGPFAPGGNFMYMKREWKNLKSMAIIIYTGLNIMLTNYTSDLYIVLFILRNAF